MLSYLICFLCLGGGGGLHTCTFTHHLPLVPMPHHCYCHAHTYFSASYLPLPATMPPPACCTTTIPPPYMTCHALPALHTCRTTVSLLCNATYHATRQDQGRVEVVEVRGGGGPGGLVWVSCFLVVCVTSSSVIFLSACCIFRFMLLACYGMLFPLLSFPTKHAILKIKHNFNFPSSMNIFCNMYMFCDIKYILLINLVLFIVRQQNMAKHLLCKKLC